MPDTTPVFSKKLRDSVKEADKKLDPYRTNRKAMLREYSGPYYADPESTGTKSPINTIYMLVSIMVPNLVFKMPKAMVTSEIRDLRPQAAYNSLRLNKLFKDIDLARTLRMAVVDSIFGPGLVKTGLAPGAVNPELTELFGFEHDPGQAFCDRVSLDNYVIDPLARRREEAWYEGNRYRLPLEYIQSESGKLFRADWVDKLQAEPYDKDRASNISRASANLSAANDLQGFVELLDLWLPHENNGQGMIVTMAAWYDGPSGFGLEIPWEGPERGPFEMLGYNWVPDNLLPISLAGIQMDLHGVVNDIARILSRQAQRQKDLLLVEDKVDDAELTSIETAPDGGVVRVQNKDRYDAVSFGGGDPKNFESIQFFLEQASRVSGNTDLLGGLEAQSGTLGQDQMLQANSNARMGDYQAQVYGFVDRIMEKLAWYVWRAPQENTPLTQNISGIPVDVQFNTEDLDGQFDDYTWKIEPYSMAPDNPEAQFQKLITWMREIIMPAAALAPQTGMALNVGKVAEISAKNLDLDSADEMFESALAEALQGMGDVTVNQGDATTNVSSGPVRRPNPQPANAA